MNWYAIYTKPARETAVAELLGRTGMETYVPKLKFKKCRGGRYRDVVEPMFPSYIFARFTPEQHLWTVKYTKGVKKVVGGEDSPWPISDDMIEFFRLREADGVVTASEADFKEGDTVRIADGPFAGLRGLLMRSVMGAERALILLKAIEYQAQVLVDRTLLVKAC